MDFTVFQYFYRDVGRERIRNCTEKETLKITYSNETSRENIKKIKKELGYINYLLMNFMNERKR